jgi:1A family penicillin-binding protein
MTMTGRHVSRLDPRPRLRLLRERMRPDPAVPARVWLKRRWWAFSAVAVSILGVIALDAWLATCGFEGCPSSTEIRAFRPSEGGRVLDRDGNLLGYLAVVRRVNVPLADVPSHVRAAFIATEDRRFYTHHGVDWRGFARALTRNVGALGVREGFSTITMQVARTSFVARQFGERSLPRKMIELRVSRLIEGSLSKEQILELYLDAIYLGNGVYGVEAASRDLFGKSVREVSLSQGAMLAALPKAPSVYTPRRDADRARRRRDLVLGLMQREGYLSSEAVQRARKEPLTIAEESWRPSGNEAGFAVDAVRALVAPILKKHELDPSDVTIHTTLDAIAQRAATRAVQKRATAIQREAREWGAGGRDTVQGAMVALDPRTGDVRALVGGRDHERGNFNRALAARRQPGSAFKPFVYAAALMAGLSPATMVDDEPVEVDQGRTVWTPANFNDEYLGHITLRTALMHSSNSATVRVSRSVGEARVVAAARRNGITSPIDPVPSIALGTGEVTPLELVAAYAPFANGGNRVRPRVVRRIDRSDGTPVWSMETEVTPAMDPREAFQLTSMLRSVVDAGTGHVLRDLGVKGPVAGKTGTTNEGTDVWFVGYTPTLVAGFWFGFDRPRSLGGDASGGRLAAPAWADFYKAGWREKAVAGAWDPPDGLVSRVIDPESGMLATQYCPTQQTEWFKPGTEPSRECEAHQFAPDAVFTDAAGAVVQSAVRKAEPWLGSVGKKLGKNLKKIFKF